MLLFVYDITNYSSFVNLTDWIVLVKRIYAANVDEDTGEVVPLPHMALVGNKVDQVQNKTVKIQKHRDFAKEHKMRSYYVSARNGDQVDLMVSDHDSDSVQTLTCTCHNFDIYRLYGHMMIYYTYVSV